MNSKVAIARLIKTLLAIGIGIDAICTLFAFYLAWLGFQEMSFKGNLLSWDWVVTNGVFLLPFLKWILIGSVATVIALTIVWILNGLLVE